MKMPETFVKGTKKINVIIETPKNSSCKFTFEPDTQLYKINKVLPEGLKFPLHFGFIPNTKGEDGDPLDALVLMEGVSYPGSVLECKIVGAIKATQTERDKKSFRNDRIITVAEISQRYAKIRSLNDLDKYLVKEVTNFFISYNEMAGKKFKPLGNADAETTLRLIKKSMEI